jgi:hypothetical protein
MTQFYAIRNDGIGYKELDLRILDVNRNSPDDLDLEDIIEFSKRNTKMSSWWKTPDTDFISVDGDESAPIPDISLWLDAALVLSPKAYRMLGDLLKSSGEFLPVHVQDETFYVFNCLVLGEEDTDKSRFEKHNNITLDLKSLSFKESANQLIVFKSYLQNCLTVFCGERFKNATESFELMGIKFDINLIEKF